MWDARQAEMHWRTALRRYLSAGDGNPSLYVESQRVERAIAVARLFLSLVMFLGVFIDPHEVGPPFATAILLGAYLVGAAILAILLRFQPRRWNVLTVVVHTLDLAMVAALMALTDAGSASLVLAAFVLLAAAHRWGYRESVATAAALIAIMVVQTALAASIPGLSDPSRAGGPDGFNRLMVRSAYFLLAGILMGYVAQTEKQLRAEAATLSDVLRQLDGRRGLAQAMAIVFDAALRLLAGTRAFLVVHEIESGRIFLWEARAPTGTSAEPLRLSRLEPQALNTYLFAPEIKAWYASRSRRGAHTQVTALDDDGRVRDMPPGTLPEGLAAAVGPFQMLMAVGIEMPGESRGRFFIVDPAARGSRRTLLAIAERMVRHVSPAIYNVYLLQRVRSRTAANERARVGRELHDGIVQSILGVQIQLHSLAVPAAALPGPIGSELIRLSTILREEVVQLREMMQQLRNYDIAPEQLVNTIADLAHRFQCETGITARFITPLERIDLSPRACAEVARVVQEALVNVRKHSGAHNVDIRLTATEGRCLLLIDDDGRGFPFAGRLSQAALDQTHQGPWVIKDRVRLLGGEVTVESDPGRGARLEITLPLGTYALQA